MFIKRLPKFEYHAPASLSEALGLLAKYDGKAKVFAGGTDLLISMKKREILPEHLISLKGIADLKGIHHDQKEGMKIGALTTLDEIEHSTVVKDKFSVLWDAVYVMALHRAAKSSSPTASRTASRACSYSGWSAGSILDPTGARSAAAAPNRIAARRYWA